MAKTLNLLFLLVNIIFSSLQVARASFQSIILLLERLVTHVSFNDIILTLIWRILIRIHRMHRFGTAIKCADTAISGS